MKKMHFVFISVFVLSLVAVMVFRPATSVSQKSISQAVFAMPDSVNMILKNSCSACHSNAGSGMAKSVWNLDVFDTYPAAKQAKKSDAICNAITKASMPPSSFRNANPTKVPTAAQIAVVCKWSKSLNEKK